MKDPGADYLGSKVISREESKVPISQERSSSTVYPSLTVSCRQSLAFLFIGADIAACVDWEMTVDMLDNLSKASFA